MAKILIIDDQECLVQSVGSLLESEGFHVIPTCDPDSFVGIMERERPDLALVDVMMPRISGDRLVRVTRDRLGSTCCPMLLWSSRPADELETLTAHSGADGYLFKSGDTGEMLRTIRRFIR